MIKRTLSFICAFIILIGAFPITAAAQSDIICVGGVFVDSENASDIFGNGTASYDFTTNTLTLNGAEIEAFIVDSLYLGLYFDCDDDVTVNTVSNSSISCKTDESAPEKAITVGVYSTGNITFKGKKILTVEAGKAYNSYAIWSEDGIYFDNSNVMASAALAENEGIAVYSKGALTLDNANTLFYGSSSDHYTGTTFTIQNGSYYIGSLEPNEDFPKGCSYLVSLAEVYFKITWKNYDGSVLKTENVLLGNTPVYSGKTPKRPSDDFYSYTFKGWDKTPVPASENAVYTAQFSKSLLTDKTPQSEIEKTENQIKKTDTDKKDVSGSSFLPLMLKAKAKKKTITLYWKRIKEADGYIIYGSRCGKKMKRLKVINNSKKVKYKFKGLKKGKYYKYIIVAFKKDGNKKTTLAKSKSVHCITDGGKRGNPTGIKFGEKKITLKKGKTYKLKPTLVFKKKVSTHIAVFRYESNNKKIASVTKGGKIKANKKGVAYIYIIAQNGIYKRVKVTVN